MTMPCSPFRRLTSTEPRFRDQWDIQSHLDRGLYLSTKICGEDNSWSLVIICVFCLYSNKGVLWLVDEELWHSQEMSFDNCKHFFCSVAYEFSTSSERTQIPVLSLAYLCLCLFNECFQLTRFNLFCKC